MRRVKQQPSLEFAGRPLCSRESIPCSWKHHFVVFFPPPDVSDYLVCWDLRAEYFREIFLERGVDGPHGVDLTDWQMGRGLLRDEHVHSVVRLLSNQDHRPGHDDVDDDGDDDIEDGHDDTDDNEGIIGNDDVYGDYGIYGDDEVDGDNDVHDLDDAHLRRRLL